MVILKSVREDFASRTRRASRGAPAKALERTDGDVFAFIDRKRFLLIRKNPGTAGRKRNNS
jgi:hypothetical protein